MYIYVCVCVCVCFIFILSFCIVYISSMSVMAARQNCPRSPSRDFAAGSELFQRLACPALVLATHCENTLAQVAFKRISLCHTQCKQGESHHRRTNRKHVNVYECLQKIMLFRVGENQSRVQESPLEMKMPSQRKKKGKVLAAERQQGSKAPKTFLTFAWLAVPGCLKAELSNFFHGWTKKL